MSTTVVICFSVLMVIAALLVAYTWMREEQLCREIETHCMLVISHMYDVGIASHRGVTVHEVQMSQFEMLHLTTHERTKAALEHLVELRKLNRHMSLDPVVGGVTTSYRLPGRHRGKR